MKILFDLFPVILFFIAFKIPDDPTEGVMLATAVAIIASIVQVAIYRWHSGRYEKMHLITLALMLLLGGATLAFQDERFIKWKPTAVNWLFSIVFIGSQFVGEKNIIRRMLEGNIDLPAAIWTRLNLAWAVFFILAGCANLYVAFHFDTATWVNFKLFGMTSLTLLFMLAQGFYLMRHAQVPVEDKE